MKNQKRKLTRAEKAKLGSAPPVSKYASKRAAERAAVAAETAANSPFAVLASRGQ